MKVAVTVYLAPATYRALVAVASAKQTQVHMLLEWMADRALGAPPREVEKTPAPEPPKRREARLCTFEGCGRPHSSRGLCGGHYMQQWQGRELTPLRKRTVKK